MNDITGELPSPTPTEVLDLRGMTHHGLLVDAIDVADNLGTGTKAKKKRRGFGGSKRTKWAIVVVGASLASAAGGLAVGKSIKSPADAASERQAPRASRITVPIERRALVSSLAVAGDIRYDDPTPIRLAGSVGASAGTNQVITRIPEVGSEVVEGAALLDVSGRPVFVFLGTLPTYRSLEPGATGPDVLQLEQALERLGFSPGLVDEIYDAGTEAAIDAFYLSRGYTSEGPNEQERERLRAVRKALADADKAVRDAQVALEKGAETISQSEQLRLNQELQGAKDGIPEAEASASQANSLAAQQVNAAIATRDSARIIRDVAAAKYAAVSAIGAIDPDTGGPYTTDQINAALGDKAAEDQALAGAEQAIAERVNEQARTKKQGEKEIKAARDRLALAQAAIADASKPPDTSGLQQALTASQEAWNQANADVALADAEIGTTVPAGEMVFVPLLPTNVTNVAVTAGTALTGGNDLATVSSTATLITGRVAKNDSDLIATGTPVEIQVRDTDVSTTGILSEIRKPQSTTDPNNPGGGGDDDGRLEIVVTPDDPTILTDWVGYSVRIGVTVSSTTGEVLAVPVAAISVGPDGQSRIEIERRRARGEDDGETEIVPVKVGLAAQGFAEITPIGNASVAAGDKVVVGTETGERRGRARDRATTDTSASDESATTEAAG